MALVQSTDPTGTTQVAELINSEYISRFLENAATDPLIGELIAMQVAGGDSDVYQVVTRNEMGGATDVAENDAAPEDSFNPTATTISRARKALRGFVLDATSIAVVSAANETLRGLQHAVRDAIHVDVMDLFTSITASAGNNAQIFDLAFWDAQTAAFRAANHDPGKLFAVLHPDQTRDLRSDIMTNAAALYGTAWGDRAAQALQNGQVGLGIAWDGYTIYESANCPVGDTTGWTGALGVLNQGGSGSAFGMVVWSPLKGAMQRDESRFGTWLVVSAEVGVGIFSQKNARALISRT